ncbi:hypothetical protein ACLIA0_09845 [Bacillaceae bacterium W0354]
MIEERLNRIEGMLSQLIDMVGKTNSEQQSLKESQEKMRIEQQEMKKEQQEMKLEQQEMKKDQIEMRKELNDTRERLISLEEKSEKRHQELLNQFKIFKVDQDVTWEKLSRVERDVELLKKS